MPDAVGDIVQLTVDGPAQHGAAVGRLPDGRACFVGYAIPGERIRARVVDERRRWARAELVEVLDPSPDRVRPPCPLFGPGRCGGCTLQHVHPRRQAQLLATVIADQLRRIGRIDVGDVEVVRPHPGEGLGYRSRARFAVDTAGHLAFRRAGSHDTIAVDDCPLLVPAGRALLPRIAAGWAGVREVGLQLGDAGDAALAVTASAAEPTIPTQVPCAVSGRRRRRGRPPAVGVDVRGRILRVSAGSFFQPSVAGAGVLTDLVVDDVAPRTGMHVLDLYAGVGVFAAALAARGADVTAVERDRRSCADARVNTADLPVRVRRAAVGPHIVVDRPVDAVVLDPPRQGAGPDVVRWITGLSPARITSVSCDPATFARDARTLIDQGYQLDRVVGVDQFTHTGHVELVGGFARTPR